MGIDAEMFIRTRKIHTPEEVRLMAYRLASTFGHDSFWIWRPQNDGSWLDKGRHCLEIVDIYEQDGPDIKPEPGEQFIQCHPGTRYFGEGYQRGDIVLLCGIAGWLEANIPGEVWYGGDSSGVCAEPFNLQQRRKHLALFYESGKTWLAGFGGIDGKAIEYYCDFCKVPMTQTTFSQTREHRKFTCLGCGWVLDGLGHEFAEVIGEKK